MFITTEMRTPAAKAPDTEVLEPRRNGLGQDSHRTNGPSLLVESRLENGYIWPPLNGEKAPADGRPVLALFCREEPDSLVGRYVTNLARALARRKLTVHLFSSRDFELEQAGVGSHVLEESDSDDPFERVQEFTHRACNAFLRQFPVGSPAVTLMGYEWSTAPALSILRGIKDVNTILSLHTLERQRCDMSGGISKRIEEIELAGLKEAKRLLIHDAATAEVVKQWAPECAERLIQARQPFPVEQFNSKLDPGALKARYQVGPVDPTILYVGDLHEHYGPDLLVKALPPVLKNHPQARLVVVGDGRLYWPLRVYARYLLLEHAVRLAGSIEGKDLYELVEAADVIVLPSREQTPWWPILAGWAAQRPIVATHAAAPALLTHEHDSILCYPSENSLVWGIERVLFDPSLGKSIGCHGSETLEERFGWNSVAAQVEELIGVGQAR
jgi:glycosyltransferase involved in cell wall biosynthesis